MAIALLRAVYHSRKAGHSAVRGAAYRTGTRLVDERTGEVCDWTHRQDDILFDRLFTPDHASADMQASRAALWNAVEAAENRGDARVAYEIKLALPHELTLEQNIELASAYADMLMQRHGQAVDLTIHKPDSHGDTRNIHAHLMLSPRALEADGFAKKKLRAITDKVQGPREVEAWRQGWQDLANAALERAGHEARINMRSYKRQGIEREGEIHLGPAAAAMERKGIKTDKGDINREIQKRNELREQAKVIDLQIEREKRAQEQQRRREAVDSRERQRRAEEARQYDRMIAWEKRDMAERHRLESRRLERQQETRREREGQALQSRFRSGFFGWWDKVTGKHERTQAENEQVRAEQRQRDEAERKELLERQQQRLKQQAERHAGLEREKAEILEYGEAQDLRQTFGREAGRQRDGPEDRIAAKRADLEAIGKAMTRRHVQEIERFTGGPEDRERMDKRHSMEAKTMTDWIEREMEEYAQSLEPGREQERRQDAERSQQRGQGMGRERSLGYER